MGFGDALGNLIPESEPELRLKDLLAPERKPKFRRCGQKSANFGSSKPGKPHKHRG
jgi:hypothetical protein